MKRITFFCSWLCAVTSPNVRSMNHTLKTETTALCFSLPPPKWKLLVQHFLISSFRDYHMGWDAPRNCSRLSPPASAITFIFPIFRGGEKGSAVRLPQTAWGQMLEQSLMDLWKLSPKHLPRLLISQSPLIPGPHITCKHDVRDYLQLIAWVRQGIVLKN